MLGKNLSVGRANVLVTALSPMVLPVGLLNWSLRPIQTQSDADDYNNRLLVTGLEETFRHMGTHKVFAPNVVPASGRIVEQRELDKKIRLGTNITLYRNHLVPADGVFIGTGQTFAMSSAGCPIIIATNGELTVVAHAGRDSLIDRGAVMGKPTRRNVSVVGSIVESFKERGVQPIDMSMCMLFAIPPGVFEHSFKDEECGEYNEALFEFIDGRWADGAFKMNGSAFLDLENIFEAQARDAGVSSVSVKDSLSDLPSLTHTRDGKNLENLDRRNLIAVKRNQ